jgi:hypothetical protein
LIAHALRSSDSFRASNISSQIRSGSRSVVPAISIIFRATVWYSGGDDVENDKGHYCFVDRWRRLWSRDGSRDAEQAFNTARFERQHSNGSGNKWRRAFLSESDWPIKAPTDETGPMSLALALTEMRKQWREIAK